MAGTKNRQSGGGKHLSLSVAKTALAGFVFAFVGLFSTVASQSDKAMAEGDSCVMAAALKSGGENPKRFWNSVTKSWLSPAQVELLKLAYDIGYADGGKQQAELMQALLLQESMAGELGRIGHMTAPVGKRSYGVMQVKVSAARDVIASHPEFGRFQSDEELIVRLMGDDEFNMRVASKFLGMLRRNTLSVDEALVAYNIGLEGSKTVAEPVNFKYVQSVHSNMQGVVKPFNRRYIEAPMKVALLMG